MKVVLRPLPVLYACQGCPEFGNRAQEDGAALDRRGLAQLVWLGGVRPDSAATERFPIFTLDGCDKGCARRWLEERGVAPQREFVTRPGGDYEEIFG